MTERNVGRLTAGVDGEVVLTSEAKLELARRVLGQAATQNAAADQQDSVWLYRVQEGRCVICRGVLSAVEDRPQLPHHWERWLASVDVSVIKTERIAARRTRLNTVSSTPDATPADGPELCPPPDA